MSINISAQIGINTENPLSIFHVDGAGDNSTSTITTAQAANDFIVTTDGNVGIGTVTPTAKLSLNGTWSITDPKQILAGDSTYTPKILMKDNKTNEIITVTAESGNPFSLNYVTYILNNVNGDYVAMFDTKIKSSDYILAVVGYSFTLDDGGPALLYSSVPSSTFVPTIVTGTVTSGTWRLTADFAGGSTTRTATNNNTNGTWIINCIIINTTFGHILGTVNQVLNSSVGSASSPPSGI